MDKKLLKYWKNCLLDAERRSRSLKKEARVTLRIGDAGRIKGSVEEIERRIQKRIRYDNGRIT
jgi:hypothetical protein